MANRSSMRLDGIQFCSIIEYSGVRITHQARIFGQISGMFFCQFRRNAAKNWRNSSRQKIPDLMNYS